MAIKPSLQSLWLADEVVKDEHDKVTVRAIFDQIAVERPAIAFTSPASLFFALRDVHGEVAFTLVYVDLSTNEVLVERDFSIREDNPLATTDVTIPLRSIPVPHPGAYAWELQWENETVGSCRVQACVTGS